MTTDTRKGRLFIIIGMFSLVAASVVLTRFHLDFAAGFGYAFGTGALIFAILLLKRGSSATASNAQ